MRRLLSTSVIVIVLASLVLAGLNFMPGNSGPDAKIPYPENTNTRVSLAPHENESGEIYRLKVFDDSGNKVSESIDYANGVKSVLYFRTDGTVKEVQDFYPARDQSQRVMKSRVYMMSDGVSFARHLAFSQDGAVERTGHRLLDGSYSTVYFDGDSARIERQIVFSQDRELITEVVFRENGHMAKRTERNGGTLATTYFRDNGTREYDVSGTKSGTISGSYYSSDGTSEVARFRDHGYSQTLTVFPDQENVSKVEVSYGTKTRKYTVFGDNEKARIQQEWKLVDGDPRCDAKGTYVLEEVVKFPDTDFVGIYSWSDIIRITMNEDGSHPLKVVVKKKNSEALIYDYYPDGSVKKITDRSSGGKVQEFEQGENFTGYSFDKSWIEFVPVDCISIPDKVE